MQNQQQQQQKKGHFRLSLLKDSKLCPQDVYNDINFIKKLNNENKIEY